MADSTGCGRHISGIPLVSAPMMPSGIPSLQLALEVQDMPFPKWSSLTSLQSRDLALKMEKIMIDEEYTDPTAWRFDEVRKQILANPDLVARKRQDLISSIDTFARWCSVSPSQLLAHPVEIRRRFKYMTPAGCDVSKKRFQNVRSLLSETLELSGISSRTPYQIKLSSTWQELLEPIESWRLRRNIMRFAKFCTYHNISPESVCDSVAARYLDSLVNSTVRKNPRTVHRQACISWNKLSDSVKEWPCQKLSVPSYSQRTSLHWESFPVSLKSEFDKFVSRQVEVDPFDITGPKRALRPATIVNYERMIRYFATMLVQSGYDAASLVSIECLARPDRAEIGLRKIIDRSPGGTTSSAGNAASMLAKMARECTNLPKRDLEKLKAFAGKLQRRNYTGVSPKNRKRLIPFRDDANVAKLFLLPQALAASLESSTFDKRIDAHLMMLVAALTILTHCPLRINTLGRLRISQNLRWTEAGRRGKLVIDIEAEVVKNEQILSFPMPDQSAHYIRRYIHDARARLNFPQSDFLFPSGDPARPKHPSTLAEQLSKLIKQQTGLTVNVHLYRHLVHLIVLRKFPGAYALVSRILGHKHLETTLQNYACEDTNIAMAVFHELVSERLAAHSKIDPTNARKFVYGLNGGMM